MLLSTTNIFPPFVSIVYKGLFWDWISQGQNRKGSGRKKTPPGPILLEFSANIFSLFPPGRRGWLLSREDPSGKHNNGKIFQNT
jgi:hypothetical protein